MSLHIPIKRFSHTHDLQLPCYATANSAGMDLLAAISEPVTLTKHQIQLIATGIAIALPIGFEAQIRPRSGLALKYGITVLNSPGTIDSDYRGEVQVMLINHSNEDFVIERGMRIAQMIITRHEYIEWQEVKDLDDTDRGSDGFGSTGC